MAGAGTMELYGDWGEARAATKDMARRNRRAINNSVRDEAMLFAKWAQRTITKSGGEKKWPKLATLTMALRRNASAAPGKLGITGRGGKPLVKTGDLRRSIGVKKEGWAHYFAGVHRTSPLVNIADIHENGVDRITVTAKMARFFMFLYIQGAIDHPRPFKVGAEIIIEQRSFLESTMKRFKIHSKARMVKRWNNHFFFNRRVPGR